MFWSGRLSGLLLVLSALMLLSSCGKIPSFLTGGGPNVAANTQIGKENEQVVGVNNDYGNNSVTVAASTRPQARPSIDQVQAQDNVVQADGVETVVVNEVPVWIVLVALLGWVLPTPSQIGNSFVSLFRRKDKG
mgnify:CR=1 FL=1